VARQSRRGVSFEALGRGISGEMINAPAVSSKPRKKGFALTRFVEE